MLLFSILGLCGGLLCCVGDILFDLKGAGNEKLGTSKNIDSNWMRMSEWRFGASILCAFFGDAGVGFGFCSIASQISGGYPTLAMVMSILAFVGCIGGFFVHSMLCIQAVIYKRIMSKGEDNFEIADHTIEGLYKAITVPFFRNCPFADSADRDSDRRAECSEMDGGAQFHRVFNHRRYAEKDQSQNLSGSARHHHAEPRLGYGWSHRDRCFEYLGGNL